MPDYHFENLDAKLFEHLAVALGQVHVARGLRPFGAGTDGGREATFEGHMDYPSVAAPWDGYLVVQCKRKETRGATPKDEADWAIAQLDAEMEKYTSATIPRRVPEYFLFVTNAELSAKPNEGGKDRFVARLDHWATNLGIRAADVWDREKLSRLLDMTQAVASRFGLLHAGDLVHHAAQVLLSHRKGVETTLFLFLQEELRADQYVRLAQAGHVGDERTPLARVFVDLRATTNQGGGRDHLVVEAIQCASDRPVYPSLIEREQEAEAKLQNDLEGAPAALRWLDASRFVLVGGPGQGKSTLVQHLAQRHRASLLGRHETASLSYETRSTIRVIKEGAESSGEGLPSHPRFPFRIVLEQFADALAKGETASVLDFLAFIVRKRTGRPFEREDAEQLLQCSPWFVALDGLDEVPAVSNRSAVMAAIRRFLGEAHSFDADLLVVATTRPQGYEEEFSPARFNHLYLASLQKDEALRYARRFVETKYATDVDRRERVLKRLETAAEEDATARLMISPLQVTIMAALVDLVGNPPRERYPLFDRYYDVVYQREQERGLGSSEVLAEHRNDIDALHDRAGLLLQISTETAGQAAGRLSGERLRELVDERLRSAGYEGRELDRITENLLGVALNRLVFIVPLEEDQYGFEVRSLQEFAAARAIMRRGSPEQIKKRLLAIAPVPYWRNTVLFAVGLVFAEREDLSDTIAQLCRELNEDEDDAALFHSRAGSRLALDILQDGVVDRRPAHRRSLLETALLLLDIPDDDAAARLATLYRPEDEGRYTTAARSAVSRGHGDGTGVFVLLALLIKKNVTWASYLLRDLWPAEMERVRWVLEHVAKHLLWDEWQIISAVQVARESSPYWVEHHLSQWIPVSWIKEARRISGFSGPTLEIFLDADVNNFAYWFSQSSVPEGALDQICEAEPIHIDWSPFYYGRSFILNPCPENLAACLSALAKLPILAKSRYNKLPWPLQAILLYVESSEELAILSKKVRAGDLGDVGHWKAAEERWARNGFTPEDWAVFTDDQVPFTSAIAERGIVPLPAMIRSDERALVRSINGLKKAMRLTSSDRARRFIAGNLLSCIRHASSSKAISRLITLSELTDLAIQSNRGVDLTTFLKVYRRSDDTSVALLEEIGKRIELGRTPHLTLGSPNVQDVRKSLSSVATLLAALPATDHSKDGIVRLLAALSSAGAQLGMIQVDPDGLTHQGLIGLVALNVFSNGASGHPPEQTARLAVDLWSIKSPVSNTPELPLIIRGLVEEPPISDYAVDVLDFLLRSHAMDHESVESVIYGFGLVAHYRQSNLGDLKHQASLGL